MIFQETPIDLTVVVGVFEGCESNVGKAKNNPQFDHKWIVSNGRFIIWVYRGFIIGHVGGMPYGWLTA